jgi:hypothetical protein
MTVHSDNLGLNIQQIDVGWVKRPYRAPNKPNLPFVDWVLSVPLRLNRPTSDCLKIRASALSTIHSCHKLQRLG